MINFPILAMSFFWNLIAVLFVICCIALILIILVQKGKGGGLSSAFGGGMSSGILGAKTGDFLTWVTIVLVCIMLFFAILLAKFYRPGPTATTAPAIPTAPVNTEGSSPLSGAATNATNGSGSSSSPLNMNEESGMTEPEAPAVSTNNIVIDTDSNQAGN